MTDDPTAVDDPGLDTTDGQRDELSTDDGLNAITALMPLVSDDRQIDDADDPAEQTRSDRGDQALEVDDDGNDPLAAYAVEED